VRKCLVLGSALNWMQDVEAALDISEFDGVVAAKRAGVYWPGKLDAWVSLHPERIEKDKKDRAALGFPSASRIFVHDANSLQKKHVTDIVEYKFPLQRVSGSSGLFAVKVAQLLGFERLVLCGIPLDKSFGKLDAGSKWVAADAFRQGFEQALPTIAQFTRSMSGYTERRLGRPTPQWLEGE
jgi:hypothetical protein